MYALCTYVCMYVNMQLSNTVHIVCMYVCVKMVYLGLLRSEGLSLGLCLSNLLTNPRQNTLYITNTAYYIHTVATY